MTTDGKCPSTFTFDRRTGEKLECERHLIGSWSKVLHSSTYADQVFHWLDEDANA